MECEKKFDGIFYSVPTEVLGTGKSLTFFTVYEILLISNGPTQVRASWIATIADNLL
jgi:hypothetical protein